MREESEDNVYYNTDQDTYKIFLKPIETRLGDLRAWNFPRMLRADNKHHGLFGKDVGKKNKTLPTGYKSYKITSKEELFNIIFHDRSDPKTGGPVTDVAFTYCYKSDGRLYLCKTDGAEDDEKCKHAWLCNKLGGIAAAGLMQFSKKNDTNIIYIDNLSGTYLPKPTNLDSIKKDFENSFPDINIELLSSPIGNTESKKQYCDKMTPATIDYSKLCESSTSSEGLVSNGELPTSGGRKKKSKKKSKKKPKKKQTKKQRKNQRKTNKNFP